MRRVFSAIVIILVVTLTLSSCEKDELIIHHEEPFESIDYPKKETPTDEPISTPEQPDDTPEVTDNVTVLVTGPRGVVVTAAILNRSVTTVGVTLTSGATKVFSWRQESISGSIVLSLEYEDTDGTPRRFTFAPTDDDWLPVLKAHIASGTVTVFTVNLYTSSVKAE